MQVQGSPEAMERMVLISAIVLVSLLDLGLGISSVRVSYVRPATGPTTECPSPCHSLQYYVSHSNFTNNSRFLFLEGEHLLDSMVAIRNVANLSLVGVSSGVKILCRSLLSGFHVEVFTALTVESVTISNCSGHPTLTLRTGSEVSLDSVVVSGNGATSTSYKSVQATFANVTFANGSSGKGSPVVFLLNVAVLFENCTFENNIGSAIGAVLSDVIFKGSNTFTNNSALTGAGVQLVRDSYIYLRTDTYILFENNLADYVGGAIYTNNYRCFFLLDPQTVDKVAVNFVGNAAGYAGSSIYGDVQDCCEDGVSCNQLYDVFNASNTDSDPSAIASDPYDICLCDNGTQKPNCSQANKAYSVHVFPGQAFPVRLAVVSARFEGVVPGAVRAYFSEFDNATLGPLQTTQTSGEPYCKDFYYSINTTERVVTFQILPEENFFEQITLDEGPPDISVMVYLKDCPLGFSLSPVTRSCECDSRIARENVVCDINDQSFSPPPNSWIGFVESSTTPNKTGVVFHSNCPIVIGYCLPQDIEVTFNTSDSQCEPHRTGLLCGECDEGYSLNLGDQMCVKCSNTHWLLVVPLAVAGLFLVAIIFILNLTVTEGTLNGLIFYANVLGIENSIPSAGYLYPFLAWINLDLGINICLFDGMDAYIETWFQFIFPAYLWVIIFVIIQLYNKFPALATRLGGENAVKVLATLLLLSYTKLQRTIATILSFTWLEYPDGAVHYVWLYDPNVAFFKGKHLYLGIAGILVLVFLIVPYTLCLTFFQQLQACSGRRIFQWVNKLKPVFDSYAGPYKDKYRFWTGMLLAVRTLLIILVTANTIGSVDFNMLTILVVSCILLMANTNGIYKKWPHSYLESFFYLQLGLFAGGIFYASHGHGSIPAVADTSIGLTIAVFLVVVSYHILCRVQPLMKHCCRLKGYTEIGDNLDDDCGERMTGLVHS